MEPPESMQREWCNCGYARGHCAEFPSDPSAPDAVRFSVAGEQNGQLRLIYVVEKDHSPVEHGSFEYSVVEDRLTAGNECREASNRLGRQARAYIESYQGRREASA